MTVKFKVLWDNGNACDVFDRVYDTEVAATDAGEDWLYDMCAIDGTNPDGDECPYSYEVVEYDEEAEAAEEAKRKLAAREKRNAARIMTGHINPELGKIAWQAWREDDLTGLFGFGSTPETATKALLVEEAYADNAEEGVEALTEEEAAAYEASLEYFNRYIAGDR